MRRSANPVPLPPIPAARKPPPVGLDLDTPLPPIPLADTPLPPIPLADTPLPPIPEATGACSPAPAQAVPAVAMLQTAASANNDLASRAIFFRLIFLVPGNS